MTFKRKVTIWIHIDHIDNAGGEVWAVEIPSRKKYFTCHQVYVQIKLETRYRLHKQPRAYLCGKARFVSILDSKGKRSISIY